MRVEIDGDRRKEEYVKMEVKKQRVKISAENICEVPRRRGSRVPSHSIFASLFVAHRRPLRYSGGNMSCHLEGSLAGSLKRQCL